MNENERIDIIRTLAKVPRSNLLREDMVEANAAFLREQRIALPNIGARNLAQFVITFSKLIEKEVKTRRWSRRNSHDTSRRLVYIVLGMPSSGKTYYSGIIDLFMQDTIDRLGQKGGRRLKYGTVSWEESEEKARQKGFVKTSVYKPYTELELRYSAEELRFSLLDSLSENNVTRVEVPGITSVKTGNHWLGRNLGAEVLADLADRKGNFSHFNYEIYASVFIGGIALRHIMSEFRDDFRQARSLQEAQRVAVLYGKIPPSSKEEWRRQTNGASIEQIKQIEEQISDATNYLINKRLLLPDIQRYVELYNREIKPLVGPRNDEFVSYYRTISDLVLLATYSLKHTLKLPGSQGFVGYNNPNLEDLGIYEKDQLFEHLAKKRKGVYVSMEQIKMK